MKIVECRHKLTRNLLYLERHTTDKRNAYARSSLSLCTCAYRFFGQINIVFEKLIEIGKATFSHNNELNRKHATLAVPSSGESDLVVRFKMINHFDDVVVFHLCEYIDFTS
jgi:hypothetical protein